MTTTKKCSRCGTDIAADAPEGICPACLMKAGLGTQLGAGPATAPTEPGPNPVAATHAGSSGQRFIPPSLTELAPHFPQLDILGLVGQGGMGVVYKVRQIHLDRLAALKILPPQASLDPAFAERFTREARAMARLNHPAIVAIYDFGRAGGYYYLLMEYIEGADLRGLEQAHRLSRIEALAIVPRICEALQYAHDEGVVHRDIKPANILLDKKGRVKITDFGLAKLLGANPAEFTLTGSQQVMGTPHYMAPEQWRSP